MARLSQIVPDLLNIEVNTIIKDEMTAQKMPSVPHTLHDIISTYARKLESYGVDLAAFFTDQKIAKAEELDEQSRGQKPPVLDQVFSEQLLAHKQSDTPFNLAQVRNGWISFEIIRLIAIYVHERPDVFPDATAESLMLERIRRNCDQLKYIARTLQLSPTPSPDSWWSRIFRRTSDTTASWTEVLNKTREDLLHDNLRTKRLPLEAIDTQDLARIRKFWEIGTERVLVQTTIQVDGDVVTRIARDLCGDAFAERRDLIVGAHRQSVDVSLKQWHGLVKVAVELIGSAVRRRPTFSSKSE